MNQCLSRRRIFQVSAAAVAAGFTSRAYAGRLGTAHTNLDAGAELDPGTMQVLFADLQVPLVAGSQTMPPTSLATAAAVLAKVAKVLKMPTTFSVVPEGPNSPHLIPELKPFSSSANTLLRTPVCPFHHPPTAEMIARNQRRTLVLGGFAAEAVVVQTALDAMSAGYAVFYVVDAIGGLSERSEAAAFRDMEHAGAVPTSVLSLVTRLVHDFISAPGDEIFVSLKPLLSHS